MDATIFSSILPLLVGLVMLGLGLELTMADFRQVAVAPRALIVVLVCQLLLLPGLGGIVLAVFHLAPADELGLIVLLASPGGAMAAVFSHLAGGDVALNISATAVNAALSLVTMPVLIGLAVHFLGVAAASGVSVPPGRVVQVVVVVLFPAVLGMVLRARRTALARRLQRPVRVLSVVAVFCAILAAVVPQADGFARGLVAVGGLVLGVCVVSMFVGFAVPRAVGLGRSRAIASSLEIGIHNVALAITVCVSVLGDPAAAVVPAMYGALMFGPAAGFAWLLSCSAKTRQATL